MQLYSLAPRAITADRDDEIDVAIPRWIANPRTTLADDADEILAAVGPNALRQLVEDPINPIKGRRRVHR
jgi:hypothetical protein